MTCACEHTDAVHGEPFTERIGVEVFTFQQCWFPLSPFAFCTCKRQVVR